MSMQPETREELFLAALAGEGEAPAPLTRRERYLKKIVEKTGSSGASVQPDHAQNDPTAADYIKNRTHWVEEVENLVFGPTLIHNTDGSDGYEELTPWAYELMKDVVTEGVPFCLVYDGVSYEFPDGFVIHGETEGVPDAYIGNPSLLRNPQGEDNGIPFALSFTYYQVMWYSDGNDHTVSLYYKAKAYHPISPDYLPEGVPYVEKGETVLVDAGSTTLSYDEMSDSYTVLLPPVNYIALAEGMVCHVQCVGRDYDGVEYVADVSVTVNSSNQLSFDLGYEHATIRATGNKYFASFGIIVRTLDSLKIVYNDTTYHPLAPSLGGVPTPTADDDGKVLKVVNGVPTWVTLTNVAEEGA